MDYSKRPIFWSGFSILFVIGTFLAFRNLVGASLNDKHELVVLLAEKGFIALLLFLVLAATNGWRSAGFRSPTGALWLLAGGTIWVAIIGAIPGAATYALSFPTLALGYAVVALLVGFGEEAVFRGIMLHALERWSLWKAALLSSFSFGAVHLLAIGHMPEELLAFFFGQAFLAMSLGLLFAGLTLRYRSIYPAIFFHFLLDTVQFWNAGGVRSAVENTINNFTPAQLALGIGVATVMFGGWGAGLVAVEVKRRKQTPL